MNLRLSIEQLKQLKGIMHTMLTEAKNANWQELTRLDSERRVLIGYKEHAGFSQLTVVGETSRDARPSSRTQSAQDKDYVTLSKELTELDKEITRTVLDARHALLEQTRVLRAQVSAKKGYEQANTMKISSYS